MSKFAAGAVALSALSLLLQGCGGGSSSGQLQKDLAAVLSDYQVLDLTTGSLVTQHEVPDLLTNSEYKSTKMVFRLVIPGSLTIGTQRFAVQAHEPTQITSPRFYLGVFEVTQAQWMLLAGSAPIAQAQPWTLVPTAVADPSTYAAPNYLPAFGVTLQSAQSFTAAASARWSLNLGLPTNDEWEFASRAGSTASFAWGNTIAPAATYAVVQETAHGVAGPAPGGSLTANDFGFYDMAGNVWEWTSEGQIRGGSWRDTLTQARCGNRITVDQATSHVLIGVRIALTP